MVKTLGLRNLNRTEINELIFENDSIQLEQQILNDFVYNTKENNMSVQDIQKLIEIKAQALSANFKQFQTQNIKSLSRAFLLILIVNLLKSRKLVRRIVIDFLIEAFNNFIVLKDIYNNPYNVLLSFYQAAKVVELVKTEYELILQNIQNTYTYALSFVYVDSARNLLKLSQVSFSFYCESGYINTENVLSQANEKRSLQRNLTMVASELLNLLFATKLSKNKPSQEVPQWIELLAVARNNLQTTLEFLVDELQLENVDTQQKQAVNCDEIKQYFALNQLLLNILGPLTLQSANTIRRLELIQDLEEPLKVELANAKVQNQENVKRLQFQDYSNSNHFGENIQVLLQFEHYLSTFLKIIQIEFFAGMQSLEKLNRKLNQNPSKQPIKEDKKKKDNKKLQMGRGTDQIFFSINTHLDFTNAASLPQSNALFVPQNQDFVQKVDEILTQHNSEHRKPKIPKGTRDFTPLQMAIKRKAFKLIEEIFLRHGAVQIDTPVFELKETLTGKYGNDSKLIYDLDDQGGELLALRYDLTVPFARYMANQAITNFKRFHIAKVYRRDQPNMTKGRYREFYQCDYDVAGIYDPMLPDAEVIKVISEILASLKLGSNFVIKVNSRKLLDSMIQLSGAPISKFKQICSSIDKLDKEQWKDVRRELIEDKGIAEDAVDKLAQFINYKGQPIELLKQIKQDGIFNNSPVGLEGLHEMELLFQYLQAMNGLEHCTFDLSLARGLDYYTGVIYEAILQGAHIGSIAGGGRYDGLIGMFSNKQIPAVGGSIGIERIFNILEEQYAKSENIRSSETQVLVCTVGSGLCLEKLKLANELWEKKYKAEIIYSEKPKPQKQLSYALENQIPFMIWLGDEEVKGGFVKLKCTYLKTEENVQRSELFNVLDQKLGNYYDDLLNGKIVFEQENKDNKDNKE